ncbi:hypothetical protein [Oceaniserpentilla sp. 4NH20-0058]|uniref:hypothetical protein n=1 Tax=Oceaniserpentilla sp. 4NH20-0058 TaxID=3127660 RepID=UPI0033414620
MKKLSLLVLVVLITIAAGLSTHDESGQQIDEWAKQTAVLFKDSIHFFSSLKPSPSTDQDTLDEIQKIDEAIESLLPGQPIDLRYLPEPDSDIKIASDTPNTTPNDLLPNLFIPNKTSGASVKGELFTDEEDKIIGGKVQLAIPTDM